ncbi:MAG TPA: prolipoprotein diacylglyceryl transferase [Firmicutes bacterium]|nr:prolipoprotein diacylglyceryl transferase [Bacillota bacterium]
MDPVAFTIGGLAVRWYGILISLGMFLGLYLALREIRRLGEDEDKFITLFLYVIPAAVIGARLYYVLFSGMLDWYLSHPMQMFDTRQGGLAIHGGLIAGFLVGWFYTKRQGISFRKWADVTAPSVILGQAIGRWGNFFNQEAYGYETNLPWAMYIDGAYRHPTFLYEFIWNILVFIWLLRQRRHKKFEGEIVLWYFILYSLGRFFIEALRTDSLMLGPLRVAQVISILIAVMGVYLLRLGRKQA